MADAATPPFSLTRPSQYDLSTYLGRVKQFYRLTDPRTLLATDTEFEQAKSWMDRFRAGDRPAGVSDGQLWRARQLVEATVHPDTGEKVFPLFRFSAFAVANLPICALLLYPTTNPLFIMGAQWVNQTYNVAINYANRNASSEMSMTTLAGAYSAAVASSCALALGTQAVTRRIFAGKPMTGATQAITRSLVPYIAVVGAGIVNLVCIRQKELFEGVTVFDGEGRELGKSVKAGEDAIFKCSIARALWTIPLVMPPLIMAKLSQLSGLRGSPRLQTVTELGILGLMTLVFVPPALAVFPQRDSLPVDKVEPEFQKLPGVDRVFFNKGL